MKLTIGCITVLDKVLGPGPRVPYLYLPDFKWVHKVMGRCNTVDLLFLDDTLRVAAPLTFPSRPIIRFSTLANFQNPLGWFSLCMMTRSPTAIQAPVDVLLVCWWASHSSIRYSRFQHLQNWFKVLLRCLTLLERSAGFIWKSLSSISPW